MCNLKLKSDVIIDNYTTYICDKFDLEQNNVVFSEIPMFNPSELDQFQWNIGLICGNSGSGKSTIMKHLGNIQEPKYDYNKSIVSQFNNLSEEEVVELLTSVGLSSIPIWLHKPNELSTGEKARLDICWYINQSKQSKSIILIDEFTSVVNRDCAKSLSFALQRYIRKYNMKIILSSCHFDIIEWLKPDWIFNLNKKYEDKHEIEHLIYADDNEYQTYNLTNEKNILTDKYQC